MIEKFLDTRDKRRWAFLFALGIAIILSVLFYFEHRINQQNTTVFAFSYKYGFISRGFLGSVWLVLNKILPIDIMNYEAIYDFTKLITAIYFVILLLFYNVCLKLCKIKDEKNMKYLSCFLSVFAFSMFLTENNFGRVDIFLMILTLISCLLIVMSKAEWLLVPICTICMLMHHGYVFMFLNIILVLLFYKAVMYKEYRKKYIVLLTACISLVSVLFLYFEFFSHPEGPNIYEEVVALAKRLSFDGESYGTALVNHEILGLDVFEEEWIWHISNYIQFPIFLVLFSPYIVIGYKFLTKLVKEKSGVEKLVYLAVALGSLTAVPQMILKVDYGRYMFGFFFYYIAIVMCLIAMKDEYVVNVLETTKEEVKKFISNGKWLIVYPLLYMPFLDVYICDLTGAIFEWIWL